MLEWPLCKPLFTVEYFISLPLCLEMHKEDLRDSCLYLDDERIIQCHFPSGKRKCKRFAQRDLFQTMTVKTLQDLIRKQETYLVCVMHSQAAAQFHIWTSSSHVQLFAQLQKQMRLQGLERPQPRGALLWTIRDEHNFSLG